MKKSHVVPMAALVALSAFPAVPAFAAAADSSPPRVQSITFDKSSVTVSGLETQQVKVSVRLTDESGVLPYSDETTFSPALRLTGRGDAVALSLAEGTDQDGIWTGSVTVTSAWASGTLEPVAVEAIDKSETHNKLSTDPRTVIDTPSLAVSTSHRPAVELTFSPDPVPAGKSFVEKVRAWDTTTGKAWANLPISLGEDVGCLVNEGLHANVTTKTKADGTYQRTRAAGYRTVLHCVWVPGTAPAGSPLVVVTAVSGFPRTSKYATSVAAAASVKAGRNVNVTGSVSPVRAGKVVQLQRLSGKTWRTVNTAKVRTSGRYTLVATPAGKATYQYRVYVPGDERVVGTYSKTVKIRGL